MKRRFLIWIAAALAALSAVPAQAACLVTGEDLEVDAKAAVIMEASTGLVLFAQDAQKRLPMASTTKIMTALLTLEQEDLDAPFVVDPQAIRVEGSSMGLAEGDTVTLRALAGGMLMSSGNDGAQAAAVRVAGSVQDFARMMNRRAAQIGMTNTHFVTPSGLDDEEHYSSAYDMALLGREALKNPDFAQMCASTRLSLSYGNPPYSRSLLNHNRLVREYEGAIGIKTGFTKKSGRCLVSAVCRNGVTLLCVTLGCGDDWNTHKRLYERYFEKITMAPPPADAPVLIPVTGGTVSSVALVPTREVLLPQIEGWTGRITTKVYAPQFLYAPQLSGDIVGKMVYYIEDQPVAETALTVSQDVPCWAQYPAPWWSRMFG